MNAHRTLAMALGLLAVSASVQATDEVRAPAAPAYGTLLQGERESAVGLVLVPWQPAEASTVDRPPALLDIPAAPLDGDALTLRARVDASTRAWRLERLAR